MDNARYHKTKPIDTPNPSKLRKIQVLELLNNYDVDYDKNITAIEANQLLRKWIRDNVQSAIVQLAEKEGHQVIFTPPHNSDLQPIELVWRRIKRAFTRLYTNNTTLKDVKVRLHKQFEILETEEGRDAISKICTHIDSIIDKLKKEIDEFERVEDLDSEEEEEDSSSVSDNLSISDSSSE